MGDEERGNRPPVQGRIIGRARPRGPQRVADHAAQRAPEGVHGEVDGLSHGQEALKLCTPNPAWLPTSQCEASFPPCEMIAILSRLLLFFTFFSPLSRVFLVRGLHRPCSARFCSFSRVSDFRSEQQ